MYCLNHKKLNDYADGRLSVALQQKMQDHIHKCKRCNDELAEIQMLRMMLRSAATPAPDPNFWPNVYRIARLASQTGKHSPWKAVQPRRHGWSVALGVILALGLTTTPQTLNQNLRMMRSVDPHALISLHARDRVTLPLSDAGELRTIYTYAIIADWEQDHELDIK